MHAFLGELFGRIPAGAYWTYGFLFFLTFVLVRSALHPTVFALVAWPGTLAHELSHATIGFILGGKPASMSLFPKSLGGGRWQLGYVEFTNLKWWSAPWTALAPMLLAPISLGLTLVWTYPAFVANNLGSAALSLYICATLLQASWPSSKDFEVAFPGLVVIGLVVAWLW